MGYQVDPSNVNVNLVRKNDGKRWSFSQTAADGYFNVENNNYGKKGCIIFRPDNISYSAGDSFEVTITGLDETISYTVEFCDINADEPAITKTSLEELINFILKKEYNTEKISDFNDDGNIDVFDAVTQRWAMREHWRALSVKMSCLRWIKNTWHSVKSSRNTSSVSGRMKTEPLSIPWRSVGAFCACCPEKNWIVWIQRSWTSIMTNRVVYWNKERYL